MRPAPNARAIIYVDTSVWCAYCFNEPETPEAVRWLAEAELDRTATAWWTDTEFASAAAIKQRIKGQSRTSVVRAHDAFESAAAMTHRLSTVDEDFAYAAQLCRDPDTRLRAGDALHLAIALRHHCRALASLDRDMNDAAQRLGLHVLEF